MDNVITWTMNQYAVMGIIVCLFGLIGLLRGVRRELFVSAAIVLAVLVVGATSGTLVSPINRMYRMVQFVVQGGMSAENPAAQWQEIGAGPGLVGTPRGEDALQVFMFAVVVLSGYLLGKRFGAQPFGIIPRILGLFIGLFNGFGITYFLLPLVFPEPRAMIEIPTGEVQTTLTQPEFLAQLVVLFIFVMIALGLYSASGRRARRRE